MISSALAFCGKNWEKCPFGIFKSPKKPTKIFPGFLPKPLKKGQIKKIQALLLILTPLFWFDLILKARAEILKKIRWLLGRFEHTKAK